MAARKKPKRKSAKREKIATWKQVVKKVQHEKFKEGISDIQYKMLSGIEGAVRKLM